jgi:hypothetical protein
MQELKPEFISAVFGTTERAAEKLGTLQSAVG